MTALNSFLTFVSDMDILTKIFGFRERKIVGPISNDIHPLINWKSFLVKIVKSCFKIEGAPN